MSKNLLPSITVCADGGVTHYERGKGWCCITVDDDQYHAPLSKIYTVVGTRKDSAMHIREKNTPRITLSLGTRNKHKIPKSQILFTSTKHTQS